MLKSVPRYLFLFTLSVVFLLIAGSCSPTRKIEKRGGYLLTRNVVKTDRPGISVYDLSNFAQPKPNKKFLGLFRYRVWIHDIFSGKKDSKFKMWVRNHVGTAPVLVDTNMVDNSLVPMRVYLNNKGYFGADVTRKIETRGAGKFVEFQTHTPEPFKFGDIRYSIKDDSIAYFVKKLHPGLLLKSGRQYDAYLMRDERERLTRELKDLGYFAFLREYIFFEVDTNNQTRMANINIIIKGIRNNYMNVEDTTTEIPHLRYYINNVFVNSSQRTHAGDSVSVSDTLVYYKNPDSAGMRNPDFSIVFRESPRMRPEALARNVFIRPGEPYSQRNVNLTYNRLQNLELTRFVSVNVVQLKEIRGITSGGIALLDCDIRMVRSPVNMYTIEAEGTNSGGFIGLGGSLNYRNRNIFRGFETLKMKLYGSIEVQPSLGVGEGTETRLFNSHETGFQTGFDFPRILSPVRLGEGIENSRPKTSITLGFNYQQKTEYLRYISSLTMGYEWNSSLTTRQTFTPFDISSISITRDSVFTDYLLSLNDPKLLNQYTDHLIMAMKYSYVYNNQNLMARRNFFFFRINLESAGNLLNLTRNLTNAEQDENGNYTLFGIKFAQYVRADLDFRYYRPVTENQKVVYRVAFGIGVPYGNSGSLPFEKGFNAGGANGLRGWPVRSLGPGGYIKNDSISYENIGDIWIEANLEYRFPIYSFLKGALFTDIGNIWLLKPNNDFPDGEFKFDRLMKTMAFDGGIGFRFDFSFFIFRIDGGLPFYDPGKISDNRWLNFSKFQLKNINWNFGIGFPF
jgi:outer membrane protein assembly factor BamA